MSITSLNQRSLELLCEKIKNKKYFLLGESTHGTYEFYKYRFEITKILIEKYNLNIIFFETEWSFGLKMNHFIHQSFSSLEALEKETLDLLQEMYRGRFPQWMWCNSVIIEMLVYLRGRNQNTEDLKQKVYVYGIDCQDQDLAKRNLDFNSFDVRQNIFYNKINKLIIERHKESKDDYWFWRDGTWKMIIDEIDYFHKEKKNKFVLFAHNSHIGDGSKYAIPGYNIGRFLMESQPKLTHKIGFSTACCTVTAGENRTIESSKTMKLNQKFPLDSWEKFFIDLSKKIPSGTNKNFIYDCDNNDKIKLFRYIGTVYNPDNELMSHYKKTKLNQEFDHVIFIYNTRDIKSCFNKKTDK